MNMEKLYAILDFISLFSKTTDNNPLRQSPDYIMEKFNNYIGDINTFKFNMTKPYKLDNKFVKDYYKIWSGSRFLDEIDSFKFEKILMFINSANWDSGTLPSFKIKMFHKYIGDTSLIIEHEYSGVGLHPVLNKFLDRLDENENTKLDFDKLNREFGIDSILND